MFTKPGNRKRLIHVKGITSRDHASTYASGNQKKKLNERWMA